MEKQYIFQVKLQDIFPLSKKKKKDILKFSNFRFLLECNIKLDFAL